MRAEPEAIHPAWIRPDWSAPANVHAFTTTRQGGVSAGPWQGLNLGARCGDLASAVDRNRLRLCRALPGAPGWVHQVHGVAVAALPAGQDGTADASWTAAEDTVCAILTADCLPVLFCDVGGSCVAAAHAGWRGLLEGVLEATVAALPVPPAQVLAWLGPAIGQAAFEVGPEVRDAFVGRDAAASAAFVPGCGDRWQADLYALARQRLAHLGLLQVSGGGWCTFSDPARFYSYRRDGVTGRMATVVWRTGAVQSGSAPFAPPHVHPA